MPCRCSWWNIARLVLFLHGRLWLDCESLQKCWQALSLLSELSLFCFLLAVGLLDLFLRSIIFGYQIYRGSVKKNDCHTPRQTVFVHNYRLKKEKEKKVRRFRETHRYENWKRIEALSDDNLRDPWPYKFFNRVRDRENSPRLTNKL